MSVLFKSVWAKRLAVLVVVVGVVAGAGFGNPFQATTLEATSLDFSAIGTSMQEYFAGAMPTIVIILGISIGVPWAIKMFKRAAR